MPLFSENEDKILGEILSDVVSNTVITRSSPGSKMRSLAEAVSRKLGRMYARFDVNMALAFINGSNGRYLDYIGAILNVARLGETKARTTSTDLNLQFYVDVGTFGTINGTNSINLPSGTIISTQPRGQGILYRLPIGVILASDQSSTFIPAEAINAGATGNVGKNSLIYHDFTNYTDSLNGTLKVRNVSDILTGQPVETDANYRFRIASKVLSSEAANATAIRVAALSVPGVAEVVELPQARGVGTFELLVQATTSDTPASLISAVQTALDQTKAHGIIAVAKAPVDIGISMTGSVKFRKALPTNEEATILDTITRNVSSYINNLNIAEDFIVNEVVERVMATSDFIKDLGIPGQPFDTLFVWRPSRLEDNKVSSTLIGNYTPRSDEKVSVENEFAGSQPILFRKV